jgi:hypothetical protein
MLDVLEMLICMVSSSEMAIRGMGDDLANKGWSWSD